jgi:uncharacterized protein YndB with AHSA1/START domain
MGAKILGTGAALLLTFLLVGYLLPSDWEASAERVIPTSVDAVMPYLDAPEGWKQWTPWPENGVTRSGPEHGTGARLSWDDPELGSGSFTLESVDPDRVTYTVDVGEGSMVAHGTVRLTSEDGWIRVQWREEGDLGGNPLMGYWALSMGRAQGEELAKGLERLEGLVTGSASAPDQPNADSVPTR